MKNPVKLLAVQQAKQLMASLWPLISWYRRWQEARNRAYVHDLDDDCRPHRATTYKD
jgi:hypothetical protein